PAKFALGFPGGIVRALRHPLGNQLRPGDQLTALAVKNNRDNHESVLGKVLARAKDCLLAIAITKTVHQDVAGLDSSLVARAVLGELDDAANFREQHMIATDAGFRGKVAVQGHVAELAVD